MMFFIMVWSIQGVEGKFMCDLEDYKYYYFQGNMCLQCDKCFLGEEVIFLEVYIFIWIYELLYNL